MSNTCRGDPYEVYIDSHHNYGCDGPHDPKTIEMRIPQGNKEECLKSAKTFEFELPIPGVVMSMESRCEPKSDEEQPEIKQVGT